MSFGFSIGDFIAAAGVVERIITEVKSYRSAPLHFQRLAIELGFLSDVCSQVFALRPTHPSEVSAIERVRAIAFQCLGPLKEFEERMKGYENTLGSNSYRRVPGKKESWNRLKSRLHWSSIARHDVEELRAVITSEILAINTLITMEKWKNSQSCSSSNPEFAGKLERLLQTTSTAAQEITTFLQDAKTASERLQRQISLGNLTQIQTLGILRMVESRSKETNVLLKRLADSQASSASNLEQSTTEISSHLAKLFPLRAYLEEWIQRIVEYCQEIITMVQRNTHTLLLLHQMMVKLEAAVQKTGIDLPILEFEDPFGVKMALPFQFCDTWEVRNDSEAPLHLDNE
ncbi:hypothetical protein B0T19DRAFT_439693 [Cercophora scortea]|uniref:NACHT-NTPase and P-loop NTPases N-terminal domain-containing protein n=1 Tax=Cercophora scortea TaxID=314031 RepID=A0AAE0IX25_9PEZI|nr:hypothetical protein B0T19DRAFT_439693 [Cercophora scortea]